MSFGSIVKRLSALLTLLALVRMEKKPLNILQMDSLHPNFLISCSRAALGKIYPIKTFRLVCERLLMTLKSIMPPSSSAGLPMEKSTEQ